MNGDFRSKKVGYQPYKDIFPLKDNLNKWTDNMKINASLILEAQTGLSVDPTRGATNWGGGDKNYNLYVEKFGKNNVITIVEGGHRHNFFTLTKPNNQLEPENKSTTSSTSK